MCCANTLLSYLPPLIFFVLVIALSTIIFQLKHIDGTSSVLEDLEFDSALVTGWLGIAKVHYSATQYGTPFLYVAFRN